MDSNYWNGFYSAQHPDITAASRFARDSLPALAPGSTLFELGCGNGRDALFFAAAGLRVIACDQSEIAIQKLASRVENDGYAHRPLFLRADFTAFDSRYENQLDVVYSRFTLHAIRRDEASRALAWSSRNLKPGGQLLLEARSVLGSLYGKGDLVEPDAYVHDGHYRRFLRRAELMGELTALGFVVEDLVEAAGLAVYKDDDPVVLRVRARRG